MKKAITLCFLLFLFCSVCHGQKGIGSNTNFWEWCDKKVERKSIVSIGSVFRGNATGCIVQIGKKRYVLTATHVTNEEHCPSCMVVTDKVVEGLKCTFANGITVDAKVYKFDIESDVCFVECDIPEELPALELAEEPAKDGDYVEVIGLGGGTMDDAIVSVRHFKTSVITKDYPEEQITLKHGVIGGDSGAPILDSKGKIVGLITGGYSKDKQLFLAKEDDPKTEEDESLYLWNYSPAFGPSLTKIKEVVKRL